MLGEGVEVQTLRAEYLHMVVHIVDCSAALPTTGTVSAVPRKVAAGEAPELC